MKKYLYGFTVIELMMVILIAAVLLAVGVPSFNNLIRNNRVIAATNDLIGDLQYARAEAIRRGKNVRVSLNTSGGGSNEFGSGYTVWFDVDGDSTMDAGEELRIVNRSASDITVDSTGNRTSFIFNARGGIDNGDVWNICDSRTGETGRQITILVSGLIRSANLSCS